MSKWLHPRVTDRVPTIVMVFNIPWSWSATADSEKLHLIGLCMGEPPASARGSFEES